MLGQESSEPVVERTVALKGDVVRFVYDDDVPMGVFEVMAVFGVALQRVDGDEGLVVVVKGIVVCRYLAPDPLKAGGVEQRQRNRKTGPELLLELLHHALCRYHEDAT